MSGIEPAPDPMIGATLTFEDGSQAVIRSRSGADYYVHSAATDTGFYVPASDVQAAPTRSAAPIDVTAIIDEYHRAVADKHRSRAVQALVDLEGIRLGLEPSTLSEAERALILAKLNNSRPREPLPSWIDDQIRQMQGEAPRPHDPVPAAFADKTPMPAATRARILSRLDPKTAALQAATSHDATVRHHVIRMEDRRRRIRG